MLLSRQGTKKVPTPFIIIRLIKMPSLYLLYELDTVMIVLIPTDFDTVRLLTVLSVADDFRV